MTLAELWPALLAAVAVLWALGAYNRLVRLRNAIHGAWAALDDALHRRDELLPPRLAARRAADPAAADAASAALAALRSAAEAMRARPLEAARGEALSRAEERLHAALAGVIDRVPADPEAPDDWHANEQRLAFARQAFNAAVDAYNAALAQFPTRLLRPLFGFAPAAQV